MDGSHCRHGNLFHCSRLNQRFQHSPLDRLIWKLFSKPLAEQGGNGRANCICPFGEGREYPNGSSTDDQHRSRLKDRQPSGKDSERAFGCVAPQSQSPGGYAPSLTHSGHMRACPPKKGDCHRPFPTPAHLFPIYEMTSKKRLME